MAWMEGTGGYLAQVLVPTVKLTLDAVTVNSSRRRAVTPPYPQILKRWDISEGVCSTIMALKTGYKGLNLIAIKM